MNERQTQDREFAWHDVVSVLWVLFVFAANLRMMIEFLRMVQLL